MKTCSQCGQIVPPEPGRFFNAPTRKKIYDYVARHPEGVTTGQIMSRVWHEKNMPATTQTVSVHIAHINRALAADDLSIDSTGGPGAVYKLGPLGARRKLTALDVTRIRALASEHTYRQLAKQFGVSYATIGNVLRGETWK